jgi:excisionase family DNA binding protein
MKNVQHQSHGSVNVTEAIYDPIDSPPLLTIDEVADYLKIKPSTVRAMCRRGELPAIKVGRIWRVNQYQLNEKILKNN